MRMLFNFLLVAAVFVGLAAIANAQQVWINASPNQCATCANNQNCVACQQQRPSVTRALVITRTLIPATVCAQPAVACVQPTTVLCAAPAVTMNPTVQCSQPMNLIPVNTVEPTVAPPQIPMQPVPLQPMPVGPPTLSTITAPPPVYTGQPLTTLSTAPCACTQQPNLVAANCVQPTNNVCQENVGRHGHLIQDTATVGRDILAIIFHPFRRHRESQCGGGSTTTRTYTVTRTR